MENNDAYRQRIYQSYTSLHYPKALELNEQHGASSVPSVKSRLSGWLPESRSAVCLDVGCGAGGLLLALGYMGYENLSGVDCSAEQVSVATRICPNVVEGDAIKHLLRHQDKFDLITAFDIVEHFHKDELFKFLDAVYRALKPGGRMIIQTPNADSPWFGTVRYGDFTHELAFNSTSLELVTGVVGFKSYQSRECRPHSHGLKRDTPLISISLIFLVTTIRSYDIPVAAISASIAGNV